MSADTCPISPALGVLESSRLGVFPSGLSPGTVPPPDATKDSTSRNDFTAQPVGKVELFSGLGRR